MDVERDPRHDVMDPYSRELLMRVDPSFKKRLPLWSLAVCATALASPWPPPHGHVRLMAAPETLGRGLAYREITEASFLSLAINLD